VSRTDASVRHKHKKLNKHRTHSANDKNVKNRLDVTQRRKQRKTGRELSEPEMDINRGGSDYKDLVASSLDDCLKACTLESDCKAHYIHKVIAAMLDAVSTSPGAIAFTRILRSLPSSASVRVSASIHALAQL